MGREITDAVTALLEVSTTLSDQDQLFCYPVYDHDLVADTTKVLVRVSVLPPKLAYHELEKLKDNTKRAILYRTGGSMNNNQSRKRPSRFNF